MIASQAGIPLYTPSHNNAMSGVDSFLPAADTIGDLLSDEGYYLTFYGGADLGFAGKGKFYSTHSFDEVHGKNSLSSKLENKDFNAWGLYDKDLFNLALDKYKKLSKNKSKFGLFLLTLGTHHPKGHYKTDIKYKDGSNEMLNAVASSDYLISKFIEKILDSPHKDDTVIVLVSDHLAMRNNARNLLDKGKRRNTFMIIDPSKNKKRKIDRKGSLLDIAPTILPFIGYNAEIGLGRDLLSQEYDKEEISKIQDNVLKWRSSILEFWDFPVIDNYVNIKPEEKKIIIDGRKYEIPILVEIDDDFKTKIRFDSHYKGYKFKYYIKNTNKNYLYIDFANNANKIDPSLNSNDLALIVGKGDKIIDSQILNDNIKLSREKLDILFKSNYYLKDVEFWKKNNTNYSLKDTLKLIKNGKLVMISVKDEARNNLDPNYIEELEKYGSNIKKMGLADSYLAVFYKNKLISEKVANNRLIKVNKKINNHSIEIKSAEKPSKNLSSIKINNKEFSLNKRGLNIVIVHDFQNNVLSTLNYDTYSGDYNSGFKK